MSGGRGREVGGLGEKDEGIKQKKLIDTDHSMVITKGNGRWGEIEEGTAGINGDGRNLDLWW